nr:retrovirus-related Pol polyprotein from transposon TNT 1-94 [Tanacetum cinerariifolium]
MFDCDELFTSDTDESLPASPIYDRYQSGYGYHAVPPPYTGTFMPPKPDLIFHDAPNTIETFILAANYKTAILKPKSNGNCKNSKACFVCKSLTYLIKDCDYYDKKVAQTPASNHTQRGNHQQYYSNIEPLVRPSLSVLSANPYKEAVNTACYVQNRVLVTKPHNKTRYELLLGKTPSISFMRPFSYHVTILNTLDPLGKFDGNVDEEFLVGYFVSSKAFTNTDDDADFGGEKPEFEGRKPESEAYVSPSSSAQTKKHDDKTKIEAKGKSPVV